MILNMILFLGLTTSVRYATIIGKKIIKKQRSLYFLKLSGSNRQHYCKREPDTDAFL